MVILMIAFIEDGMRIPMGIVTSDYLRAHRLAPTQCAPTVAAPGILSRVFLFHFEKISGHFGLFRTFRDVSVNTD